VRHDVGLGTPGELNETEDRADLFHRCKLHHS
jgi:hypothetical protein